MLVVLKFNKYKTYYQKITTLLINERNIFLFMVNFDTYTACFLV